MVPLLLASKAAEVALGRRTPCKAMAIGNRRLGTPMAPKVEEASPTPMAQGVLAIVAKVLVISTSAEASRIPCQIATVLGLEASSTVGRGTQEVTFVG